MAYLIEKDNASNVILRLFEKTRVAYLSAKEDPKEYGGRWRNIIEEINRAFSSEIKEELENYVGEEKIEDKDAKNPESNVAKDIYEAIKLMRYDSEKVEDPFADKFKGDVLEALLSSPETMVKFVHYALRSDDKVLSKDIYSIKDMEEDTLTEGLQGLDLQEEDISLYIIEHYGDDKDTKQVEKKVEEALNILELFYFSKHEEEEFEELVEIQKEQKANVHFLVPNKPMYRIFDIEDMNELKGFSGEYVVQEKYDGMRIQLHKIDGKVSIYSYNEKDITEKCKEQVKELEKKEYGDCILDAELILFDGDKALHRADTIAHVFKNSYKESRLKAHVFDILRHENQKLTDEPLRKRINILFNNYSTKSSEDLFFPSKKDTRIADNLKDVKEYAEEIMEMPTSEGVVIKDIESTYFIGTKKNPKWVKWKKFVDLDLIVLDKKSTKSGMYSYTLGAGPIDEEDGGTEIDGKFYMNVGKALNTKTVVNVGQIVRVKVDEVKESGGRYTLYSAKVIEIPEVEAPDKIVTLEMLAKDTKPSLKYNVEALKKGITITDNIHGTATIIAKSMDGFTIYGFQENNLMAKNALQDLDFWKEEAEETLKTMQGKLTVEIINFVRSKNKPQTVTDIHNFLLKEYANDYETLLESNKKELGEWIDLRDGLKVKNNIVIAEDDKIVKESSQFKVYLRKDGNLSFAVEHKEEILNWNIDIATDDDIFAFFGKAVKYPAEISTNMDRTKLLDEGEVELGVQRHGYHEYILKGNKFETKLHFRVVETKGEKMWIAWTGYEQKPVDKSTDEGVWNIYNDKFKDLKLQNKAKQLNSQDRTKEVEADDTNAS